jgi:cell division protein FtsB
VQNSLQRQLIPRELASTTSQERTGNPVQRLTRCALGMRRKVATVLLGAMSLSLGVYAIFGHDGLVAYQQKQRQAQQLQQQILSLKKENERMALHDQRLQNDRNTIEYEAREQMHYTRPGEVIYTLPEAPGATNRK